MAAVGSAGLPGGRNVAYRILADVIVCIHLGWILFLILGAIPGSRWRWVRWLHLAALTFSIALQSFSWICPLTDLEIWLRTAGGAGGAYRGSFIGHYAERLVYAPLPRYVVFAGTLLVVGVSLWIYYSPKRTRH